MCELSFGDKLDIVHQVLVKHMSFADVMSLYKVKHRTIEVLVKKTKSKDDFFKELKIAESHKDRLSKLVEDTAN